MKKILVFAGSNCKNSINQWFAQELANNDNVDYFDTRTLDIPMYNKDIEETGFPIDVIKFYELIRKYNKVVIVSPEYNGYPPSFFKNILDWVSRYDRFYFDKIDIVITAVAPGKKAGASVRDSLSTMLSFTNANEVGNKGIAHFDQSNDYSKDFEEIINYFK